MTVAELLAKLQSAPPDARVVVFRGGGLYDVDPEFTGMMEGLSTKPPVFWIDADEPAEMD